MSDVQSLFCHSPVGVEHSLFLSGRQVVVVAVVVVAVVVVAVVVVVELGIGVAIAVAVDASGVGGGDERQKPVQRTGHSVVTMAYVHRSFVYVVPHRASASG